MYTEHFGLDDGPFHGKAEGEDVYVGPQQATVISRLRKALCTGDTAVAVSGPVGVGKTTLVRRAIADIAGRKIVVSVDRIRLEPDEVLDLLLSRFHVSRQPKGTIQRVAAFRRLLQERLSDDVRVFIVVEDAERVGVDALIELEALTATDGGEPVGTNIVLMGDGELPALLTRPALARLRQRIRLRQSVVPFDAAEVEGYMRHCLEAAGGVFEQIFEPGTARIVHRYSGGIARVVDNLCESTLVAAAEAGVATILPEFLQEVAESCGLEPQGADNGFIAAPAEPVAEPAPPPVGEALDDAAVADAPVGDDLDLPAAPASPPKLSLVEKPPAAAGEPIPDEAPTAEEPEPEAQAEPAEPVPAVADARDAARTAASAAASREDEWKARSASLTVSRIDEVLPELLERLQSSARGRSQPGSAFAPAAPPQTGDDTEIPTLSNSMRIAVLPMRRMDERPLTAEDVSDDEVPVDVGESVVDDEPTREARAFEPAASEPEPKEPEEPAEPEEDTGIAEALAETDLELPPELWAPIEDERRPSDFAAEEIAAADGSEQAPGRLDAAVDEAAAQYEDRAADDAMAEPEPLEAATDEPAGEAAASGAIEPPVAGIAETGSIAEPAAELEPPAPEAATSAEQPEDADDEEPRAAAGFELSLVSDESLSTGTAVAGEADDEETTEAATLSVDEALMLAPEASTDLSAAGNDAGDAGDAEEPELDALQAAIQAANAWQASEADGTAGERAAAPPGMAGPCVPEITLDAELEKQKPSPSDQLDRWAEELSKAKSLEDISDILAETIFGNEEIEAISAEIRAKKAAEKAAAEPAAPSPPKAAPARPGAAASAPKSAPAKSGPARPAPSSSPSRPPSHKASPSGPARPGAGGINMTMSQRIEMVNSLKGRKTSQPPRPLAGMPVAEIVLAERPDDPLPKAAGNAPAPIEAQIDTAITQSRKVLSEADLARMAASADNDGDDDGDKKGRGLFGFFRRSSKS